MMSTLYIFLIHLIRKCHVKIADNLSASQQVTDIVYFLIYYAQ